MVALVDRRVVFQFENSIAYYFLLFLLKGKKKKLQFDYEQTTTGLVLLKSLIVL